MMTLEELFRVVNDSTAIELFSEATGQSIETYCDKDEVPEEYMDCEVTDVFAITKGSPNSPAGCWSCLGVEIEVEE